MRSPPGSGRPVLPQTRASALERILQLPHVILSLLQQRPQGLGDVR